MGETMKFEEEVSCGSSLTSASTDQSVIENYNLEYMNYLTSLAKNVQINTNLYGNSIF